MNSTPLFGFFSSLLWLCVSCNEYLTGLWRELFGVPSYFHVVTGPLPSRLSGLRPQPHCDHQRTTAAVREGDLKVKPLVDSAKLNKISSSQPLLNKYMVWWRPEERHTVIFIFSWSLTMLFFPLLYVIFSLDLHIRLTSLLFIFAWFLSSAVFVAFLHQCTYQFLFPLRIQGFPLCCFQSVRPQLRQI